MNPRDDHPESIEESDAADSFSGWHLDRAPALDVWAEGDTGISQTHLGYLYGVTRQRAQQIESDAIEKLRLGCAIEDAAGVELGGSILRSLTGKPIGAYRKRLSALTGGAP